MSPTWPPDSRIKRRLVEDDQTLSPAESALCCAAIAQQGDDHAFGLFGVIAQKIRRADLVLDCEPDGFRRRFAGAGPGLARLGALALHGGVEGLLVDADLAGAQRLLRQIEREAVSVVKLEGDVAGKLLAFSQVARFLVEDRQAARQRDAETGFLQLQGFVDQRLRRG